MCAIKFELLLARLCSNVEMGKESISVSQEKLTLEVILKITLLWNLPDTNLSLTLMRRHEALRSFREINNQPPLNPFNMKGLCYSSLNN